MLNQKRFSRFVSVFLCLCHWNGMMMYVSLVQLLVCQRLLARHPIPSFWFWAHSQMTSLWLGVALLLSRSHRFQQRNEPLSGPAQSLETRPLALFSPFSSWRWQSYKTGRVWVSGTLCKRGSCKYWNQILDFNWVRNKYLLSLIYIVIWGLLVTAIWNTPPPLFKIIFASKVYIT